jgi:hypothetical protein
MNVLVEIFVVTPDVGQHVGYRRGEVDISQDPRDPDEVVLAALRGEGARLPRVDIERCLIHSTSWRHAAAGTLVLTYLVYGEEIDFAELHHQRLPLSTGAAGAGGSAARPRPVQIKEGDIVLHGMRHIGHLVQRQSSCVSPCWLGERSRALFATLEPDVAGRFQRRSTR